MYWQHPHSGEDSVEPLKKKPKKQYYVRANPLPRILKRDIRRDYATMFVNVMNSIDLNNIDSFFRSLSRSDCQVMKFFAKDCYTKHSSTTSRTYRVPSYSDKSFFMEETFPSFIYHSFLIGNSFPDFVFRVNESSISQTEGVVGSKVIVCAEMLGTKPVVDCLPARCIHCRSPEECFWFQKYKHIPKQSSHSPQFVMHLDESHRMYKLELIVSNECMSLPPSFFMKV